RCCGGPPTVETASTSRSVVSIVSHRASGEYRNLVISHLEPELGSNALRSPPSAGTSRIARCDSEPLTYAIARPSGRQTGKFPSSATRRAEPPSVRVTQTSPPYVRNSKLAPDEPVLMRRLLED